MIQLDARWGGDAMTRRELGLLAFGAAASTSRAEPRKLKVLVTGGHPGDPEYGCGGTIARYTGLGHDVALVYLNRGEKHCPESPEEAAVNVRVGESRRASEILGARALFADQCDAHAIVDGAHYDSFRALVERENPDILFTHWPVDNHRDHRAISMLSYDAWLHMNRRFAFYYYEVSDGEDTAMFQPTDYVDIAATEARKRSACYAHASQSPDRYYALQMQIAKFRGIESGHAQAEAFLRHVRSPSGLLP